MICRILMFLVVIMFIGISESNVTALETGNYLDKQAKTSDSKTDSTDLRQIFSLDRKEGHRYLREYDDSDTYRSKTKDVLTPGAIGGLSYKSYLYSNSVNRKDIEKLLIRHGLSKGMAKSKSFSLLRAIRYTPFRTIQLGIVGAVSFLTAYELTSLFKPSREYELMPSFKKTSRELDAPFKRRYWIYISAICFGGFISGLFLYLRKRKIMR